MATKSSGMSLIELLVVVAILGILSTVGIVSYNGYVSSSKKNSGLPISVRPSAIRLYCYLHCAVTYIIHAPVKASYPPTSTILTA